MGLTWAGDLRLGCVVVGVIHQLLMPIAATAATELLLSKTNTHTYPVMTAIAARFVAAAAAQGAQHAFGVLPAACLPAASPKNSGRSRS